MSRPAVPAKRMYLLLLTVSLGCGACVGPVFSHTPSTPIPPRSASPLVAPGTRVEAHLEQGIVTRRNVPSARFVVTRDVVGVDGSVALPAGSPVLVEIDERPHGPLGREGVLRVRTVGALTPAGEIVPLTGETSAQGINRAGRAAGLTIGMFFVYFPFNFLHLLTHGTPAYMPDGQTIHAIVSP